MEECNTSFYLGKYTHKFNYILWIMPHTSFFREYQVGTALLYIRGWSGSRTRIPLTLTFGENFKGIVRTGIKKPPNLSLLRTEQHLHIVDLESNQIEKLVSGELSISAEQLIISTIDCHVIEYHTKLFDVHIVYMVNTIDENTVSDRTTTVCAVVLSNTVRFRSKTCVAFDSSCTLNQSIHFDNIASASEWLVSGFKSIPESSTSSSISSSSTAVTFKIICSSFKISNPPSCLSFSNQSVTSFVDNISLCSPLLQSCTISSTLQAQFLQIRTLLCWAPRRVYHNRLIA
ncbi:hypothetical protein AGLY_013003 [Aphis glycines]|uniref:Uncharacterized protein n=1 Tax=Aphis glycines TaxID=307491 RepID=A0A6G0T8S8_APHGL|nr:hypothetical protein AGLY_013003 [Aphis glycines]